MRYGSVCSGIEAASCAWHSLGWQPQWFAEIASFPSSVLRHRFPEVPNHGDFTRIDRADIDLLVGGTPCQSFSVAGLRGGLADDRGNLALEFLRLAARSGAKWVVWENVPGVLSSGGGRDFGSILGGLAELGYGWAYRVLDAQFFGVPQRRRRVFVVGYLGDWRRAAAVLFERHGLSWNPPPSREAGERVAAFTPGSIGGYREGVGTMRANGGDLGGGSETLIGGSFDVRCSEVSRALTACKTATGRLDPNEMEFVTHSLRGSGFDASEDGTGRGTPMVTHSLSKQHGVTEDGTGRGVPTVAVQEDNQNGVREYPTTGSIRADAPGTQPGGSLLRGPQGVRRLTPRECERLQGFPDDWTLVPHNGKPAADGPRYEAIGNSMAVPVMRWIGERIAMVDAL